MNCHPSENNTNECRAPRASVSFLGLLAAAGAFACAPLTSLALPSFARQMNMQCSACHTEFPVLTQFGREFKLTGYTQSADTTNLPPFAVMLMPSFTHTQAAQAGGAAPGFSENNNTVITQASLFYGGRLFGPYAKSLFGDTAASWLNKVGVFSQMTYDGVAKTWSWDNTEIRFADSGSVGEHDVTYGVYANNNPTLQDPWNSTPAWGYPYVGSGLAPSPTAGTFIDGAFAAQVVGVGAYVFVDDSIYVDVGAYKTLGFGMQRTFGVDPTGEAEIAHPAPYWRLAYETSVGDGRLEFGTFGMTAMTYPGRDSSMGTDKFTDVGLDSEYQISFSKNDLTAMANYVHESQSWSASYALGNTANPGDSLDTLKLTVNDVYDKTYAGSVQYFNIDGTADTGLYTVNPNGSPNSDGFIFQVDYMPFNKDGGPKFWPRSNVQFTLQYTVYNRFEGARSNYDGAGTNASANNTLYAEAWIAF